eukprot:TRINITY_DN8987_c0_g1_i1.p1 TRINITY_DN8987_c0_g1~~TRINITY_DN8987_c0_g1_i1.p1  ORF type:complete len:262 (-),score=90.91 TRINITY_DN8987_c0_g1_i1:382-1167(-)
MEGIVRLLEEFRSNFDRPEPNLQKCIELVPKLKIALTQISFPDSPSANADEETRRLVLAREILEYGALFSLKQEDVASFERFIAQLKTYYTDFRSQLPPSVRQYPLLGANLLRLLAKSDLAGFHTELELIPADQHSNLYLKHPIQLEQSLMEGAYNRVLQAKAEVPSDIYIQFTDQLMSTVRNEIAECIEAAYGRMPLTEARRLLGIADTAEFTRFVESRNWNVSGDAAVFEHVDESKTEIPALKLIQQQLNYARELERIV